MVIRVQWGEGPTLRFLTSVLIHWGYHQIKMQEGPEKPTLDQAPCFLTWMNFILSTP